MDDDITNGVVYSGESSEGVPAAVRQPEVEDTKAVDSTPTISNHAEESQSDSCTAKALRCLPCTLLLVLTVFTGVVVAINRERIILILGSISVDPANPTHCIFFILGGLALFAVQFIGVSWFVFTTSYFFRYPAIGLCLLTTMFGITMNFAVGRGLKKFNYKSQQFSSSSPSGTTSFDKLLRHIETKPFKFASLAFCSPVPVPMLCTLLGLSTEVQYPTVLCAGTTIVMLNSLPIVMVAASATSLADAFDNPFNVVSTLVTIVAAVGFTMALSAYTKKEIALLEDADEDRSLLGHYDLTKGKSRDIRMMAPWPVFALTEDLAKDHGDRRCCSTSVALSPV